ncbi:MAG: PadR family transcriptional regulator [Clostridia bacterium]
MQQFKKGSLEMVLLCLICVRETYGYEIITRLNEAGGGVFGRTREGTVYPVLYRLEKSGLIRSRMAPAPANGGMKKYYAITAQGRLFLAEMTQYWRAYTACVDTFVNLVAIKEESENDAKTVCAAGRP